MIWGRWGFLMRSRGGDEDVGSLYLYHRIWCEFLGIIRDVIPDGSENLQQILEVVVGLRSLIPIRDERKNMIKELLIGKTFHCSCREMGREMKLDEKMVWRTK